MEPVSINTPPFAATAQSFRQITPLHTGDRFSNRYELVRIIGRGGMGVVWLAHDEVLNRSVALKFLPDGVMHDRTALKDLRRETARALLLTHVNIVRVYDFVEDQERGLGCIAMEYVDGENLNNSRADRDGHCFEAAELSSMVRQLCAALDYAHETARIVHSDLKPANLMMTGRGDLKVTDFGIARSLANSIKNSMTAESPAGGTLHYMSPQQARGLTASVSDDIYALGATLYDLLTGRPPFWTGSIYDQVQRTSPPSVSVRRRELKTSSGTVPKAWEEVIAMCLAKEVSARPASGREVAIRLGLEKGQLPLRWRPRRRTAAALAAVALSGAIAFGLKQYKPTASTVSTGSQATEASTPLAAGDLGNRQRLISAYLGRAQAHTARNDHAAALTVLREGLAANPDEPTLLGEIALCYEKMGMLQKALDAWREIVQRQEPMAGTWAEVAKLRVAELQFSPTSSNAPIYEDNFDRTVIGDNWRQANPGPSWSLVNGELRGSNDGNKGLWLTKQLPTSARIEFDARALLAAADIKFETFASNDRHEAGYVMFFGGWGNTKSIISRGYENMATLALNTEKKAEIGRTYHFVIQRRRNTVCWFIDGEPFLCLVDSAPLTGRQFAFHNFNSEVFFDNLKVYDLAKEKP